MKFYESTFNDYLESMTKINFNEKIQNLLTVKDNVSYEKANNLIFYGQSGTGKYSQALLYLKQFSKSELKYEKKMQITHNGKDFLYKLSDVHYEIDMSLLGCNSKLLWNDIYHQIIDIVSVNNNNFGYIVCKNFHNIQIELLEVFYSYIQKVEYLPINIKFILITENLSFIPENILNNMMVINFSKLSKNILKSKFNKIKTNDITNLKELYINDNTTQEIDEFEIFDDILTIIKDTKNVKFYTIREKIYNLLVYNIEIDTFLLYTINDLIKTKLIAKEKLQLLMEEIFSALIYYNNNYRPIYHLEKIVCIIIKYLNEDEQESSA